MSRWLLHPRLTLLARLALGVTFILAALPKLADPPSLAKAIWGYQLVPALALNPMALVLPWLELLCGLALLAGAWVRAAALWVGTLLLAFVLGLALNLAQQRPIDCGCFGTAGPRTEAERLADMRWDLLRDLGLLLLVAQVLAATAQRKP